MSQAQNDERQRPGKEEISADFTYACSASASLSRALLPLPEPGRDTRGQAMPQLPRQDAQLSTMVSLVRSRAAPSHAEANQLDEIRRHAVAVRHAAINAWRLRDFSAL